MSGGFVGFKYEGIGQLQIASAMKMFKTHNQKLD